MSNLIESLSHDRHTARYQAATRASLDTRCGDSSSLEHARDNTTANKSESTRSRAGWLLIGLGLRLVTRGGDTPASRARLIGQ
jgi:hypothetical protein